MHAYLAQPSSQFRLPNQAEVITMHKTCTKGILPLHTTPHMPPVRIIRMKEFVKKSSLSKSTLCDRMNKRSKKFDDSMPRRIPLSSTRGKGAVGYLESEVDNWILQQAAMSQSEGDRS